jgi:hypothetical protein
LAEKIQGPPMNTSTSNWLFALALTIPMLVFFFGYFFNYDPSLIPTGFIQYDNVSYLAFARQYLDSDQFRLMYSNPFNDSGNYPAIYFQPHIFILFLFLKSGLPIYLVLPFFVSLCSFFCFRLIIPIYDHLVPQGKNRALSIWFFAWGGGLLTLAGMVVDFRNPVNLDFFDRIFILDPAWGWWGLNLGRSLFFSCEAFYHLLFLGGILCILKQKWSWSLLLAFILSISHPFTGIEFLCIAFAWSLVERIFIRNKKIPWWFVVGLGLILAFHIYYYLFYLNQFEDHRSVNDQYSLNWRLRFFHMIPAYCIVGILAIVSVIKTKSIKNFLSSSITRLLLCWFIIAFTLANHELFISPPMQPLHFTRGYVWTSLFLLGLPALQLIYTKAEKRKGYKLLLILFTILFLSDNFIWIANYVRNRSANPSITHISKEEDEILKWLEKNTTNNSLILGSDYIPYLSTVYTKAYPWSSHPFTTPFYKKKSNAYESFIQANRIDSAWKGREVLFIFRKQDGLEAKRAAEFNYPVELIKETDSYKIIKTKIR